MCESGLIRIPYQKWTPAGGICWWGNALKIVYTRFILPLIVIFECFFASHWPPVDSVTIRDYPPAKMIKKRDQCTPSTIFFHPFPNTMSSPWCICKKESEILGDRVETALKPTKYNQSPCITRKLVQVTQLKLETILHVLPNPGFLFNNAWGKLRFGTPKLSAICCQHPPNICILYTPQKTNMSSEQHWLEDYFPFEMAPF